VGTVHELEGRLQDSKRSAPGTAKYIVPGEGMCLYEAHRSSRTTSGFVILVGLPSLVVYYPILPALLPNVVKMCHIRVSISTNPPKKDKEQE